MMPGRYTTRSTGIFTRKMKAFSNSAKRLPRSGSTCMDGHSV